MFTQILHIYVQLFFKKILCTFVQLVMVTLSEFCSLFATVQCRAKLGTLFLNKVETCTADITPIRLLNHALCACKILWHLSLFDVHQARYRFLYTNSNCFVLERFLVSMLKSLNTQVSWQLHKLTSICQFFSSQLHWEQWKRMNFVIQFKTIKRIGVITKEKNSENLKV
jgi:hypothetical protein